MIPNKINTLHGDTIMSVMNLIGRNKKSDKSVEILCRWHEDMADE